MKFVHKRILLCTLLFTFSLTSHGQDMGNVGFRAGYTMPTGILGTLLKPGVGFGIQFNSTYFYQVRGRFTADVVKYNPSNLGTITKIYNYNSGQVENADFTCKNFSTLDGSIGLDYKILPDLLPWFYCGPEVLVGMDLASFTYSNPTYLNEIGAEPYLHTA
ncbi:MAG: hypothetical protein ACO29U_02935, partial [Crocinitomicaceae bacterium]